jgi:pimeloyl-ACP methyl ester carboxylesterase
MPGNGVDGSGPRADDSRRSAAKGGGALGRAGRRTGSGGPSVVGGGGAVVTPEEDAVETARVGEGRIVKLSAEDGLSLAVRVFDAPGSARLPLLCLPGLSRNSRDFIPLGRHFAEHPETPRRVFAVDYRGRGLSARDPNWRNYTPLVEAADVLAVSAALGIERAIVVGTSRGGIIAMLLGALRPAMLAGIVLNDIGPIIEGRGLARIKGTLSVKKRTVPTLEDAIRATREAGATHYPNLTEGDWRTLAAAYYVRARDGFQPDYDPHLAKAIVDLDVAEKVPDLWPQFMSLARVPVLAIRGSLSDILSAATVTEMARRHPDVQTLTIADQGHPPLLRDAPSLEAISAFAARCDPR